MRASALRNLPSACASVRNTPLTTRRRRLIPPPPAAIGLWPGTQQRLYQTRARPGYKLGVFASSDHIPSTLRSAASMSELHARRNHRGLQGAAEHRRHRQDFRRVSYCNGQVMGSVFETTGKPELRFSSTAPRRSSASRWCERDEPPDLGARQARISRASSRTLPRSLAKPLLPPRRADDGNMAWSSPVG